MAVGHGELIDALRALEASIRARGVASLAVFGSRARGDHRDDSDLDLLVELEPGHPFSALDWVSLGNFIGDDLGVETNVFFARSLEPGFRNEIARDLIRVF